jgi:hypothetical protein
MEVCGGCDEGNENFERKIAIRHPPSANAKTKCSKIEVLDCLDDFRIQRKSRMSHLLEIAALRGWRTADGESLQTRTDVLPSTEC